MASAVICVVMLTPYRDCTTPTPDLDFIWLNQRSLHADVSFPREARKSEDSRRLIKRNLSERCQTDVKNQTKTLSNGNGTVYISDEVTTDFKTQNVCVPDSVVHTAG